MVEKVDPLMAAKKQGERERERESKKREHVQRPGLPISPSRAHPCMTGRFPIRPHLHYLPIVPRANNQAFNLQAFGEHLPKPQHTFSLVCLFLLLSLSSCLVAIISKQLIKIKRCSL
jgi:hypothetical protein